MVKFLWAKSMTTMALVLAAVVPATKADSMAATDEYVATTAEPQLEEVNIDAKGEALEENPSADVTDPSWWSDDHDAADADNKNQHHPKKDPMLRPMPDFDNFEAYVRPDVATFYRKPKGSMEEKTPIFPGQAAKFVNMSPEPISLYWVGEDPVLTAQIGPWQSAGIAASDGHQFILTKQNDDNGVLAMCTIHRGYTIQVYDPYVTDRENLPSYPTHCKLLQSKPETALEDFSAEDQAMYRKHEVNHAFARAYKNFTGGSEWLTMYPKDPPKHYIRPAEYFGQKHIVPTQHSYFHSIPDESTAVMQRKGLTTADMLNFTTRDELRPYQQPGPMNMTLEVISCGPRIFKIDHFLSDTEVAHILHLVEQKTLARSSVAANNASSKISDTRTSRSSWLSRESDPVLDVITRRMADALQLDESLLRPRLPEDAAAVDPSIYNHTQSLHERMQVVHYAPGQQFTPHHDFTYPRNVPGNPARSINFCLYLNNVTKGGQTSFPRFRNAHTRDALNVQPKQGSALIFYMQTPDGNLDDLTHHAGLPVEEGEKYFTNLWIWDPKPNF